jgi:hypothetical protein
MTRTLKIHRRRLMPFFARTVLAGSLLASACSSPQEKAAKDWCLALRACQLIPIYPLSEDLRPGDVFLVQRPIGQQVSEYKSKGYLSLDDHRVRLAGLDYKRLYRDGYFSDPFGETPHPRALRAPGAAGANGEGAPPGGDSGNRSTIDVAAPRASFPVYSFTVDRGEGLSLAFPIQGVPVALNFMGAQKAVGSVSITDARTYAADATDLYEKLEEWAREPTVQSLLKGAAKSAPSQVWLRVVKRVYLVGGVDVSITNVSKVAGAGRAGVLSDQADNPGISTEDFEKNLAKQAKILGALQEIASKQGGIGAAVKFTEASDRSVSLRQTFDVPQVAGYLGMDVPVFEDGSLGAPFPTFERLKGDGVRYEPQRVGELSGSQRELVIRMKLLETYRDRTEALDVVAKVSAGLEGEEGFKPLAERARALSSGTRGENFAAESDALIKEFRSKVNSLVAKDGALGARYLRVIGLMDAAILGG